MVASDPQDQLLANRARLITPPGVGALAVVQVSGPGLGPFFERHFSGLPAPGEARHGRLTDLQRRVIDDPVVARSPDGRHVDICLHGGTWVVAATIDLLAAGGFEIDSAAHRDVTWAADNDVIERAVLEALPAARTALAVRTLLSQPAAWRMWLAKPGLFDPDLVLADKSLWRLLNPPTIALVGAANAGKSTLANRLLARERSIVADLPGTTRDWVAETVDLDGLPVTVVDTPGFRSTDDPLEAAAIGRSADHIAGVDLLILVLDATRADDAAQEQLARQFPDALRVVNKVDLASIDLRSEGWIAGAAPVVATTGQGVPALVAELHRRLDVPMNGDQRPRWWNDASRAMVRSI